MPGIPANTGKPNERKLNFWERLYLPEIFKGLGYSFRKMVKEPLYTFQYPEEQWYPPDSYRGRPVLVEEAGRPRCVSCNLCARACPPMAISMESREIEGPKEREPAWFEINMLRCIYCGYCEEVCPEEAIVMSKEYDLTFQSRDEAIFGLDRLLVPVERLKDRLDYLEAQRNRPFGQTWSFQRANNIHSLRDRAFLQWLAGQDVEALEAEAASSPAGA
ncbi:NADH-quinone oxidoreductase subunit I [Rhodocaloribacter litoris]|uniref:NuoI/complex I 23 kDa subunit family protein n=1 Tax=Rhodocaloribacter litoris TaxID=2558931 RepID=UPI00141E1A14|nr:NADH-quinone oxidoreductase subunit I [Rhodocaloribacter litoris]QXD17014.1 NADH-quinone oxidoreductase subunit I [Rhodocaloribacter litoris]